MAKVKGNQQFSKDHEKEIGYQVAFAKLLQEKAQELLENVESKNLSQHEIHDLKKQFKFLQSKSQQVIVLLQVLAKLNKEVANARLELERAVRLNSNVKLVQRKVKWLERRLKNFLFMSRGICHIDYQGKINGDNLRIHPDDLSASFVDKLSNDQKERLLWKENANDDIDVDNFMNMKEEAEVDVERLFSLTSLADENSSSEEDENKKQISFEERNESKKEKKEMSGNGVTLTKFNTDTSLISTNSDMVDDYWNSDHHRFEWTNFMQKLDPLSWHSLAISHPDSFLKGGEKFPTDKIPWRLDRDLSEGSAFSKKSIEKLHEKLQTLFQAIIDASVNSVKASEERDPFLGRRSVRSKRSFRLKQKIPNENETKNEHDMLPYLENRGLDFYENETKKLFSRPVSVILPVVKQDTSKQYPRQPQVWCDLSKVDIPKHSSYLRGTKKALKDVPTITKKKQNFTISRNQESRLSLRKVAGKVTVLTRLNTLKDSLPERDELKWKRISMLLGETGIKSDNKEIVIDALKSLSQLGASEKEVVQAIREKVADNQDEGILYEASKCLISLGIWDAFAVKILRKGIENGKRNLKLDILDAIINARNAQYVRKEKEEIVKFIQVLTQLACSADGDLAFKASLSLGHLCVVDSAARDHLYDRLNDASFSIRAKALETLVRQMNCKDVTIIDAILCQLSNARNWKQRVSAAELLQFIGVKDVTKDDPDKVFDCLERLLWNHPSTEVRTKVAEVINDFGMRPKSIFLVYKRLEDLDENVRSNAIQMLSSLRMKGEKELKLLLDMVELDSSINVRIQVLQAFNVLKWNDVRIIRSLQEREKGDGILAREAEHVLHSLMGTEKTNIKEH